MRRAKDRPMCGCARRYVKRDGLCGVCARRAEREAVKAANDYARAQAAARWAASAAGAAAVRGPQSRSG